MTARDAVMLSAESAAGKYPVESVAMMAKIIVETERQMRAGAEARSAACDAASARR